MRPVTRNALIGLLIVLALLLALGAVPNYLRSGDPYYVTAETIDGDRPAVNASDLPERRYPYTTEALRDAAANGTGQSAPYWKGPYGVKESFTHSPFDELSALRMRNASATDGDALYVTRNGTLYRLAISDQP
jgi:hypothetical protein